MRTAICILFFFFTAISFSQKGDEYIVLADSYKKKLKPDSALIFYKKASLEFQDKKDLEKLMNAYTRQEQFL